MTPRTLIQKLAEIERVSADMKHGEDFNSLHEACAVVMEELQEVRSASAGFERAFASLWIKAKRDDENIDQNLMAMETLAYNMAAESVQLLAMAGKIRDSKSKWNKANEKK